MPQAHLNAPAGGLHAELLVPSKAQRRTRQNPYKRKLCRDDRNYVYIQFTISGDLTTGDFGPMWRAERNFWVARVSANCGKHDNDTHPNDGTPSGSSIQVNVVRIKKDLTGGAGLIASDSRVNIQPDKHHDSTTDDAEGEMVEADINIPRLYTGDHIFPRISQVGSGRPGTGMVVTAVLVPVP